MHGGIHKVESLGKVPGSHGKVPATDMSVESKEDLEKWVIALQDWKNARLED